MDAQRERERAFAICARYTTTLLCHAAAQMAQRREERRRYDATRYRQRGMRTGVRARRASALPDTRAETAMMILIRRCQRVAPRYALALY